MLSLSQQTAHRLRLVLWGLAGFQVFCALGALSASESQGVNMSSRMNLPTLPSKLGYSIAIVSADLHHGPPGTFGSLTNGRLAERHHLRCPPSLHRPSIFQASLLADSRHKVLALACDDFKRRLHHLLDSCDGFCILHMFRHVQCLPFDMDVFHPIHIRAVLQV